MRPIIGVTAGVEPDARWRVWEEAAALLPASYLRAVTRAGGRVVLLPPDGGGAGETIGALDGLVLSGGIDIDPALYGAEAHPETGGTLPERDHGELALLRAALDGGLPVLGVCRGAQLIAVAHGGSLHQHLPEVVGHDGHQPRPGRYGYHEVRLAPGTRIGSILGATAKVASHHHQGMATLGTGLDAVAWAEDGSIEAVESTGRAGFLLGVLWHPEQDDDEPLFAALVDAARGARGAGREVTPG